MNQPVIVVDVGCARHPSRQVHEAQLDPEHFSIERLVDRFHPSVLYAFDPHGSVDTREWDVNGTRVISSPQAAWSSDGTRGFLEDGAYSRTLAGNDVPCFRLADFIAQLPPASIVVKLDCEGDEYELLSDLIDSGIHDRVTRFLVEWHGHDERRQRIERVLGDRLDEWGF